MAKRGECFAVDCMEIGSLMGVSLRYVSDVHRIFSKAHDSLIKIGFLKSVQIEKQRPKKTKYVYLFNPEFQDREILERKSFLNEIKKEDGALLQRLVDYGIGHDKSNELIEKNEYAVKMVLQQLDHDQKNGKRIKNPAGFIIKFISDGWIVPEYIEANIKRHENYPNIKQNSEKTTVDSNGGFLIEEDVSQQEMEEHIAKLDKDILVQMYKQIFELARIQITEKVNPETFNYKDREQIDSYSFSRIKMIFEGMISEKIIEERKAMLNRVGE